MAETMVKAEKGIINAIRFFLGIEVVVLPLTADLLGLGDAEIGINWILGPSNRAALYSFNIRVDRVLTNVERRQIRAIVELVKPAHTHFITLMEPGLKPPVDAWSLGISNMGIETRLG